MRNYMVGSAIAVAMAMLAVACDSGPAAVYDPSLLAGTGGEGGAGRNDKGVGEPCETSSECRPGLACDDTCQPAGTSPAGIACIISAECAANLYCEAGICASAGDGAEGDSCTDDGDCRKGLRCALEGLSARCAPEGTVDVGGACDAPTDCYGGLTCIDGACAATPAGLPPFGRPWDGVSCDEPTTPVEALFYVPRPDDGRDFFSLPFPNDVRRSGNGLDLSGFPTPGSSILGYDPVQRYVDAVEKLPAWGTFSGVYFRFSGDIDVDTLEGNVQLVDLTAGAVLDQHVYAYAPSRTNYICHNRVHVSRGDDAIWEPGHVYAALLFDGIRGSDGGAIHASPDLEALLADGVPSDSAVAAHHGAYAPLRQWLVTEGVARAALLNASVFTVRDPRARLSTAITLTQNLVPPTVTSWTLCDGASTSPCGDVACGAPSPDFHELHALVSLPIFQTGNAPYLTPSDGGTIATTMQRTEPICMTLTVPKGAVPPQGFPTVIHAHGTNGDARSHIANGIAGALARGVDDGQGDTVVAATVGITQVQHGKRRNGSLVDPQDLFFNFQNPAAALGNPQQAALDQVGLRQLVPTLGFDAASSPTGEAFELSSTVAFWGHSQGATAGALATPYGDWAGIVFSGQGASLRHTLVTKSSPVNIASAAAFVLGDFDADGSLRHGARHPALAILQTHIDGADPVTYARLLAQEPPAGHKARHVFQVYGVDDTYTPSAVQAIYALNAGFDLVAHDVSVVVPDPLGDLAPIAVPASGNIAATGFFSALVREYAPPPGSDGHFVAFDVEGARTDALRFLAGALAGNIPQVGP